MGTWSLVSRFHCCLGYPSRCRHLEFLIGLLFSCSVLKNTYVTNLVTWILKLRDIFERPWRDLCRHGNPWDRSQSSVEAGGLFSNMADFRKRRHLDFLICRWRYIHVVIWLVQKVGAILALENNSMHYCLSRIGYHPYEPCILLTLLALSEYCSRISGQ